jgi:hypothetical protein
VRTSELLCPFCQCALPASFRNATPPTLPTQRLTRAALFAFGLLGAPACEDDTAMNVPTDAASGSGGSTSAGGSGGVAMGQGGQGGSLADGGLGGSAGPVYGAPAVDANTSGPEGGAVALYGGPPPSQDASPNGAEAGGGIAPLYGAPSLGS